jgi:flagellar hook-associated protein 1
MSLFSSIHLASNSLNAMQIGLQVVGQNIANANTPGYIREDTVLTPAPTQQLGGLLMGMGVQVSGIIQKIDHFLAERLRGSQSEQTGAETEEQTYLQLEGLLGELTDTDLSTSLNNFFNSIHEVLNQPESASIRNLAVLQGETLAGDINRISSRVRDISNDINTRIVSVADDINRLTKQISVINVRISAVEGGGSSNSDAVGLRDQREVALTELAKLVDVRAVEQKNGTVSVYVGGEYLVLEGIQRPVKAVTESVNGLARTEIQIDGINAPLKFSAGELAGLFSSRDKILGGFLSQLDDFSGTLAYEFNKVYSKGQGLKGYTDVTSEFAVDDPDATLDAAGLKFTPTNGSFDVLVLNKQTGLTQTTTINVDLNGLDDDMSLAELADALNSINGISASIDATNHLQLNSDSSNSEFSFAGDTSGILAALGVNTFFSGYDAGSLGINQKVADDPSLFAASSGGIGEDSNNAVELAAFLDRPLEGKNGTSISTLYDRLVSQVTQGSTVTQSVAEGYRVFSETLYGQHLALTGVNLDEEAVKMITYQRAYQASARYISTLSDLLDILVNL